MTETETICGRCKHFNKYGMGCKAFENIPYSIIRGENKHSKPLEGQDNDIVFEEK